MRTSLKEMPATIIKYVVDGTMIVNFILLLCHICFGILFYIYKADVMFYYNCISIITYIFSFELLRKSKAWAYVIIVYVEIFLFMILAVIFLGWDYGFQQYCIGFVASIIFTDFYMNHERVMSKRAMVMVSFDVIVYMLLRFWTYNNPYIYEIKNTTMMHVFYTMNSLIGFSFLIMYSSIYSSTVYKLENELLNMANIDPLTGLCNRRKMQQMLKAIPIDNENKNMVIAMIDVDFFKKINDTYGHDAGDEVLKMLASVLDAKNKEKENFQVCRWGGEEFLIFYGNCNGNQDEIVSEFEDIRKQIEDAVVEYEGKKIKVTITIGLAFHKNGTGVEELIKIADDNLYVGKQNGRDRVIY